MNHKIQITFSPLLELICSLIVLSSSSYYKKSDLGASWHRSVKNKLTPALYNQLTSNLFKGHMEYLEYIILFESDSPFLTVDESLQGLNSLTDQQAYEKIAKVSSLIQNPNPFSSIDEFRNTITLLREWDAAYFKTIDPEIIRSLHKDTEQKRKLLPNYNVIDFVEFATKGIRVEKAEQLEKIVLVPQYHANPVNLYTLHDHTHIYRYPVDAIPIKEGEPDAGLLRLTQAISDRTRLKLLRFIAQGNCSFTDIVKSVGLTKSTVHQHLILLRACGLVRVHFEEKSKERLSLRQEAMHGLQRSLYEYVMAENPNGVEERKV